jgi:transposase
MNELSVTEKETILGLLRMGWSVRHVARETGRRHETIRRYGQEAGVLEPRSAAAKPHTSAEVPADPKPPTPPEVPADLEAADARGSVVTGDAASKTTRSTCEPFRSFIAAELVAGRNATGIFQDLVEHHGYVGSYDAVKRFARTLVDREPKVFCRFETPAGLEGQVDYGEGAPTLDPRTRQYRKPRLFVMTLSFSHYAFRKTVWHSSKRVWCELHEEAFAHFGGAPKMLRFDCLKEGVLKPDIYDPELNPLYAAVLAHYNIVALPCRPYAPNLKGKIESAVSHTQRALQGKRFKIIDDQNAFLMHWDENWASTRIHGTTKRQVREMFEQERSALLPLPPTRFEYYEVLERKVHFDGHIEVGGAYYSAPPRYVGANVVVHAGRLWLRILDPLSRQCVRQHTIALTKGSRRTADADRPKQTPPQVEKLVARVAQFGPACGAFARALESEQGALCTRTLFGLLDLIRRYDVESVERACALAATARSRRLRFLRAYLEAHAKPIPLADRHRIIAPIDTYAIHFKTLTQGDHDDD